MPSTEISKPVRRVAALLGFLWKPEVDAHFKQEPFETIGGANHLDLWAEFDSKRAALPILATKAPAALPATASTTIQEVRSRSTFKEYYEVQANFEFVSVDIESLLSPQWYADLDYIDEIVEKIPNAMSTEDMLRFVMSEGKITQPIVTGNTVHFTSPRRDLFASPIPLIRAAKDGGFEVVIKTGSRPNYVQVTRIGGKLFLNNGVHKVCALLKKGYKECVCALRTADHLQEIGINPMSSRLFSFLDSPRPALVADFLNESAAAQIHMQPMYQILQVQVQSGHIFAPALSKGVG